MKSRKANKDVMPEFTEFMEVMEVPSPDREEFIAYFRIHNTLSADQQEKLKTYLEKSLDNDDKEIQQCSERITAVSEKLDNLEKSLKDKLHAFVIELRARVKQYVAAFTGEVESEMGTYEKAKQSQLKDELGKILDLS